MTLYISSKFERAVFWDVTWRKLSESYRRFEGAYCHHFLGRIVSEVSSKYTWSSTYDRLQF
jgi:hypothetical protein